MNKENYKIGESQTEFLNRLIKEGKIFSWEKIDDFEYKITFKFQEIN